jgi:hypothetical protein
MDDEKISDLVRDAFYEGCRDMQSWNGTLGPMSEDEIFAAWTESESRKQLVLWLGAGHAEMSRDTDWKRISALAGLDENGGILPPPAGAGIDRGSTPYWKTRR